MADNDFISGMPSDVLEIILKNKCLSTSDVINFGMTSKSLLNTVTTNNSLWKTKFEQKWPSQQETTEKNTKNADKKMRSFVWLEETKTSTICRNTLIIMLKNMAYCVKTGRFSMLEPPLDMRPFDLLFMPERGANPMNYYYLIDHLTHVVNSDRTMRLDRECAKKTLFYIQESYRRLPACTTCKDIDDIVKAAFEKYDLEKAMQKSMMI